MNSYPNLKGGIGKITFSRVEENYGKKGLWITYLEKKVEILTMHNPVIIINKELIKNEKKRLKTHKVKEKWGEGNEENFSAK